MMKTVSDLSRQTRKRLPCLVIAAMVWGFAPAALLAEDPGQAKDHGPWERLSRLDTNQDGEVSREEFDQGSSRFPRLDSNGDGVLTEVDFEGLEGSPRFRRGGHHRRGPGRPDPAAMAGMIVARLADDDGDGAVADGEWRGFLDSLVIESDGSISQESLLAALPERRAHRVGPDRISRLSRVLDRDGDEVLEIEDLSAVFTSLDSDGDGALIGDEMPHFGPPGGRMP
ncbi:MAG: hypothetical protein AAF657_07960 [Acidobacteriota bacterium]